MAIQDTQKIDYLWKKLGYGATKTDTNTNKKAPNEAIASPLILRGDKVWQQAGDIPSVMPGSSAGVVTVYPTSAPDETTLDGTATANRSWKTGLTDWIPPELGSTYQAKVYIHTSGDAAGASGGDQVFATGSGNDDEWFFDYQSGVLHFIGDNLPDGISFTGKSVYISGARYTGTFGVGAVAGEDANIGNLTVSNTTVTSTTPEDDITLDAESGTLIISGTDGFVIPVGTTGERPGSPTTGQLRLNSSTGDLEFYDGANWEGANDNSSAITSEKFDGDNTTTAFTLSNSATTETVFVSLNGVIQLPTTAYTVSGTTLTFTEAPGSNDKIEVRQVAQSQTVSALTNSGGTAYVETNSDATVDIVGTEVNFTGIIKQPQATKAADATGTTGQIAWDSDYIYICTATNTWKRVALTGGY